MLSLYSNLIYWTHVKSSQTGFFHLRQSGWTLASEIERLFTQAPTVGRVAQNRENLHCGIAEKYHFSINVPVLCKKK